jgi:exonuclease VII large subunit
MNLLRQLQLAALSEEIKKLSTRVVNCQQQSNFNIQKFFYDLKASLEAAKIQLLGLNPVKPLEEGFALVCSTEGEPLTFDQLQEGQNISVNFERGKVSATIIEKSYDSIYKRLTCSSRED